MFAIGYQRTVKRMSQVGWFVANLLKSTKIPRLILGAFDDENNTILLAATCFWLNWHQKWQIFIKRLFIGQNFFLHIDKINKKF